MSSPLSTNPAHLLPCPPASPTARATGADGIQGVQVRCLCESGGHAAEQVCRPVLPVPACSHSCLLTHPPCAAACPHRARKATLASLVRKVGGVR